MSNLWDNASTDHEAEAHLTRLTAARLAVTPLWSFLASSESPEDYANRRALSSAQIEDAVQTVLAGDTANYIATLAALDDQLVDDYVTLYEQRVAARREAGKSDLCPKCGEKTKTTSYGSKLVAKCNNCGWGGTKTKKAAAAPQGHRPSETCEECGAKRMAQVDTHRVACADCGHEQHYRDPNQSPGDYYRSMSAEERMGSLDPINVLASIFTADGKPPWLDDESDGPSKDGDAKDDDDDSGDDDTDKDHNDEDDDSGDDSDSDDDSKSDDDDDDDEDSKHNDNDDDDDDSDDDKDDDKDYKEGRKAGRVLAKSGSKLPVRQLRAMGSYGQGLLRGFQAAKGTLPRKTAEKYMTPPGIDNPEGGPTYDYADHDDAHAVQSRFDSNAPVVKHPTDPNKLIFHPGNFWDGPTHVTKHSPTHYSFQGVDYPNVHHFDHMGRTTDEHGTLKSPGIYHPQTGKMLPYDQWPAEEKHNPFADYGYPGDEHTGSRLDFNPRGARRTAAPTNPFMPNAQNPFVPGAPGEVGPNSDQPNPDDEMAMDPGTPQVPMTTGPRVKPSTNPGLKPPMMAPAPTAPMGSGISQGFSSKAQQIAIGIRETNPGVSPREAMRLATQTLKRFPAMLKSAAPITEDLVEKAREHITHGHRKMDRTCPMCNEDLNRFPGEKPARKPTFATSQHGYPDPSEYDHEWPESKECPHCGGQAEQQGTPPNPDHYRCRDCGTDMSGDEVDNDFRSHDDRAGENRKMEGTSPHEQSYWRGSDRGMFSSKTSALEECPQCHEPASYESEVGVCANCGYQGQATGDEHGPGSDPYDPRIAG